MLALCSLRLDLEWMQLAIEHQHWFACILVVVGHSVEPLGIVESDDREGAGADEVLLEGWRGHVGRGKFTLARQQRVFVRVELLLYISSEHFLQIN